MVSFCHRQVDWVEFRKESDPLYAFCATLGYSRASYVEFVTVVQECLAKHPRFNMHFTPTSAFWLNTVERFFRDITTERLRRGVFTSAPELISAIDEHITHHNIQPKPFIWTKSTRDILQKVIRANSRLRSKQNAALTHPKTRPGAITKRPLLLASVTRLPLHAA